MSSFQTKETLMENTINFETLFKYDSKEKVRIWRAEIGYESNDLAGIRVISGLADGKQVTSDWKICEPKNLGKVNATNALEQAQSEIASLYQKQKDSGYGVTLEESLNFDKFKPMLAQGYKPDNLDFKKDKVFSQPKLDGIRCVARRDGLWTREGKEIVSCPHIYESLIPYFEMSPNAILDGELYNHELKDDFNKITSLVRKTKPVDKDYVESESLVQYHVYDIFENTLFEDRYESLNRLSNFSYMNIVETSHVKSLDEINNLYRNYVASGYEGQMIRLNRSYENKRSKFLLKRKEFVTEEFKVLGVEEGVGNWSGAVKRFIIELPDGRPCGSGVRGKYAVLSKLFKSGKTPDWATVRYFELTPDGMPRFPVVIDYGWGQRDD